MNEGGIEKAKSAMMILPKPTNELNDDATLSLEIKIPLRMAKYVKLGKMMPPHIVVNGMKMGGLPKILISQFEYMKNEGRLVYNIYMFNNVVQCIHILYSSNESRNT